MDIQQMTADMKQLVTQMAVMAAELQGLDAEVEARHVALKFDEWIEGLTAERREGYNAYSGECQELRVGQQIKLWGSDWTHAFFDCVNEVVTITGFDSDGDPMFEGVYATDKRPFSTYIFANSDAHPERGWVNPDDPDWDPDTDE